MPCGSVTRSPAILRKAATSTGARGGRRRDVTARDGRSPACSQDFWAPEAARTQAGCAATAAKAAARAASWRRSSHSAGVAASSARAAASATRCASRTAGASAGPATRGRWRRWRE